MFECVCVRVRLRVYVCVCVHFNLCCQYIYISFVNVCLKIVYAFRVRTVKRC